MGGIIRLISRAFDWLLGKTLTINHRGSMGTTTSSSFVPWFGIQKKARVRVSAIKVNPISLGTEISIKFGYFDKRLDLKLDKILFNAPPIIHFDISERSRGCAPIVYNVTPEGCEVMIVGKNPGCASPECALLVTGVKRLVFWPEIVIFFFYKLLIYGLSLCSIALVGGKYFGITVGTHYLIPAVVLAVVFASLDFHENRLIKGIWG